MINLIITNLIIILVCLFLLKKIINDYYLTLVLVYLITLIVNFSYLNEKLIENNLESVWFNFAFISFFITIYSWLYGVVTKSVSLKMLLYIKSKKLIKNTNLLTNNIVKKEFDNRINIIKKLKLVIYKNNKFLLNKKGIKTINQIIAIRKIFNIVTKNFYY